MENFPEGLIYILILVVAFLANLLFKRFGPMLEPEPAQAEPDEGQMVQEPVPVGLAAASNAATTPLLGLKGAMLHSHPGGQFSRRTLMGSKRNKQAAIAMATILGPCRAFESDGNPASPGP